MPTCKNCGHTTEISANNCPMCGVAFEEVIQPQPASQQPPVQEQPVFQQPQSQPAYDATPVEKTVPVSAKVKGFIGMGLGIEAIVSSFLSYIFVILAFTEASYSSYYYSYYDESYAGYAIGFSLVELAMAIAGVILSSKAREAGFESAPTKLGKIFGIISIPLYAFAMFLAFIALAVNM